MESIDIVQNCRACQIHTKEESQRILIFNTVKLPDIFKETTSLDIQENDGLPKVLCCSCYDRLLEAYNFRKMCSAAALHFQKILSMDVPEEKYTPPENLNNVYLTDNIQIKTEPDSDVPNSPSNEDLNYPPDRDDSSTDISDMLSIDANLPEVLKTELDDDVMIEQGALNEDLSYVTFKQEQTHEMPETSPETQKTQEHTPLGKAGKFKCGTGGTCNKLFDRKSQLEMHIWKEHLGLKPFKCEICGKEFKSSASLSNHLKTHKVTKEDDSQSDINQNVCEVCGIEKPTAEEFNSHMDTHKKDNKWSCDLCPYQSTRIASLKHHVKVVHQGVKEFHCPRCEKSFTEASSLKLHMKRHEGIKNHVCTVCGVKKVTARELRSHMNTHTKDRNWSCELCPYKCSLSENLRKHVKVVHEGLKQHHCSKCNKSFSRANSLKYHLMLHTGERPHSCSQCAKKFITMDQLKVHMNIHTRENIFSCEFCPYTTIHRMQIGRHIKIVHQGVRNYKCPHCKKALSSSIGLKNHIMIHTGEKPRACNECGKRFIQYSTLKNHMKIHLRNKPEDVPTTQAQPKAESKQKNETQSESSMSTNEFGTK